MASEPLSIYSRSETSSFRGVAESSESDNYWELDIGHKKTPKGGIDNIQGIYQQLIEPGRYVDSEHFINFLSKIIPCKSHEIIDDSQCNKRIRVLNTGYNKNKKGKQTNGGIDIRGSVVQSPSIGPDKIHINKENNEGKNQNNDNCDIKGLDKKNSDVKPSMNTGHNTNKRGQQNNGHIRVSGEEGRRKAAEYDLLNVGCNENNGKSQENESINWTN